jgi:hypothetical protein
MIPRRALLIFISCLLAFFSLSAVAAQQTTDGQFFDKTGHWVRGEFYTFWKNAPDPTVLFGYPITEAIPHPINPNTQVQYFQRARMEYDPNLPEGQRVSLTNLGDWIYDDSDRGQQARFQVTASACRAFVETGKNVCYAFLQFYDRFDGPAYFGLPISEVEIVDRRLVQYFERARMEWRPEMPSGQRVILTDIGRLHFDVMIGDYELTHAESSNLPQRVLTEMRVNVFSARPLLASGEQQRIFTVVQDQYHQPLKDAEVMVTVRYPDGRSENYRPLHNTDADGLAETTFTIEQVAPNQVIQVEVEASITNGPKNKARTWFRIWW